MKKKEGPFRTGFWFGGGFMVAAYLTMFLMDGLISMAILLLALIMRGLGFAPGV